MGTAISLPTLHNEHNVADARRQISRDPDAAYQQGQLDALVRAIQQQLTELNTSLHRVQEDLQDLRGERIGREEFLTLSTKVETLSRWQWMLAGGVGFLVLLTQIVPKIVDIVKK